MDIAALLVLDAAAAYLAALGIVALVRPGLAGRFLRQFAQTPKANWIEALCRFVVGLSFVRLAAELPASQAFSLFGWFLAATAVALVIFPTAHRQFADRLVPGAERFIPTMGVVAIAAGIALAALLWPLHGMTGGISG
ncbi:hypothetical protein [Sphingomonas xanthus]|uniref:Uncharacterized protein n=1 Tax=Sphingomonas xanthus TaxID=2594473 RepID=A0A516IRQ9_9SPHN|nr:hypothetical protein [Sphingomonas xanthus]QDP19549.1 hypothetical protein FMM02_05975 [Sphingomonas xanthus]